MTGNNEECGYQQSIWGIKMPHIQTVENRTMRFDQYHLSKVPLAQSKANQLAFVLW